MFPLLRIVAAPLLLGTAAAIASFLAAGPTLGVFLGGLLLTALLAPPLVLSADRLGHRLIAALGVLAPFAAVWLAASLQNKTRPAEFLACFLILLAWVGALAGVAIGLTLLRLPPIFAAAVTILLALLWLTWPIWLSPTWKGSDSAGQAATLSRVHPAMALNGQLHRHLGVWTEQSIAYHLTDLSQDVPYALPATVWPALLLHGLLAAGLIAIAWRVQAASPLPAGPLTPAT